MDFPEEVAQHLTTPEGMATARAAVFAAFGIKPDTSLKVSGELHQSFLDIIDGVEAGTIKTKKFDKEEQLRRGDELLAEAGIS